jgi:ATP adenylyltransferase
MDYLWSPWRMKYILGKEDDPECVFCHAIQQNSDHEYLIIHRGQNAFIMLNRFPYTSGHLMVLPYQHVPSYENLNPEIRSELMELVNRATMVLRDAYQPHGFNVGANLGEDAGAGLALHLHFHLVPRWRGDSNFMSVASNTRVLPEALMTSYDRIKKAWINRYSD